MQVAKVVAGIAAGIAAATAAASATAAPVLMSPDWAQSACAAWDQDPVLTEKLVASGWVKNDGGRGFKVMQLYRSDCGDRPTAEMRIALKDGKAQCVYGGAPQTQKLEMGSDYVMYAKTPRWLEMGRGEYGPMTAMFMQRLGFEGPKLEAMRNMEPFGNFLLLVGKVDSDVASCPAAQ